MAQTAVDRMDEYLGMKDGPERNFSQTLQDRRDESIGATESSLVDRLFKSVQDAFQPLKKSPKPMSEELFKEDINITDADKALLEHIREVNLASTPPIEEDTETTEVITESPAGAAALDETMQLPPAMELAQMGYGMGSGYAGTPKLREGLGTMIDEAQAAAEPLSKYEQMLLLASLGIPAAALGGRAVGGLMSKLGKGGPKNPQKLGRPIPTRGGPATQRILGSSQRDFANKQYANKGLESLKQFMGKESLRRPQVSKMAGAKFVDPDHKKVFTRAFGGPKDNTMYMWSDDAADYFKDTMSRKTFKIPRKGSLADDLHDYPQW